MMQKPGTPSSMPSKSTIFNWITQIVPESSNKMKVEDLGDGVIYCRIMNHYFPGTISMNRLNTNPKNEYDYSLNLKLFQNSLTIHKITVPFDVGKIAKQKFLENWGLINALYRQLSANKEESCAGEDSKSVSYVGPKFTPKRSFEAAFPNEQAHKMPEVQSYSKPVYGHSGTQQTVHYQSNQLYHQQSINSSQHSQPQQSRVQPAQLFTLNPTNHQNPTIHSNQVSVNTNLNNGNYHLSGISQTAFGGFNFGASNNVSALNLMSTNNSNLTFNRPQTAINRDTINPQNGKGNLFEQQTSNKCWSVGKLPTRESLGIFGATSQQNSGKYSVNSHIFQNNYNAVIDRVKEILLKNSHDIEKIRQIKILLNIPLNEDIVKIEEQENVMINCTNIMKETHQSGLKQAKVAMQNKICTKQTIQSASRETIELPEAKSSKSLSNCDQKQNNESSKSISNSSSIHPVHKSEKLSFAARLLQQQSSGKKIKNNFFGEGTVFRK